MLAELEEVIARELGIPLVCVTDDLAYQSIYQWDSLRHVGLILALEKELGLRIDEETVAQLQSVGAIRHFMADRFGGGPRPVPRPVQRALPRPEIQVHRGLENVYFDRSKISYIDGQNGVLQYCGYDIGDLVENRSCFEEVVLLLLDGELPEPDRLQMFRRTLQTSREVPAEILKIVRTLADAGAHPTVVLQTAVSALGAMNTSGSERPDPECARADGIRLIAQIPTLIGAYQAQRSGNEMVEPDERLGHAANLLYVMTGTKPDPKAIGIIEDDLIVHADHGSNASTFAARVAISCQADLHAAVTAAIAAFSGPLHGGACERVMKLIEAVGKPENAERYVRDRLAAKLPVMGFGHRVYRTDDPRVHHIRRAARRLAQSRQETHDLDIIEAVVRAMQPFADHGIGPNVDLYSGLVYRQLGLPDDMAVPMFVASRITGWVAQSLEQMRNNVLIRPRLMYVGAGARPYSQPYGA